MISKNKFLLLAILSASVLFFSCGSTANMEKSKPAEPVKKQPMGSSGGISSRSELSVGSIKSTSLDKLPKKLTEAPKFDFTGDKLQIELENMYYDGFDVIVDESASGLFALRLENDASWAVAEVNFPAGTYEGVASVLATDSRHNRFNISINKDFYLVYGSEPPIGRYELTTRAPASFTLDQPATVTVKIQQNDLNNPANNGHNGMTIDYISFKKIN